MSDTLAQWQGLAPKGMFATIYAARCGWHVTLSANDGTAAGRLKPQLLGKYCVPYKANPDGETMGTEAGAMVIALYSIRDGEVSQCDNL